MRLARYAPIAIAAVAALAIGCQRAEPPLTPEAARAKGDALLKEMSKNVGALQSFGYTADERREVVAPGGAKTERVSTRHVIVRRPNGLTFTGKSGDTETTGWYDGSHITFVSNKDKVWARGPMPGTLDEALDFMAAEYAVHVPTADLLYSSPYDALITKDTTGGWVDVQQIGDVSCDHLVYHETDTDWEIWLGPDRHLARQFKVTYKKDPGQPSIVVSFHDLEQPQVTDETFAAKVPDGYNRIKIMRHATVEDPNADAAAPAPPPSTPKK
jgi:hypothetical protein